MLTRTLLFYILFMTLELHGSTGPGLHVDPHHSAFSINPHLSLAREEGPSPLSLEEAQKLDYRPLPTGQVNLGFDTQAYWLRFQWHRSASSPSSWVLLWDYPLLDWMDTYIETQEGWQHLPGGDQRHFSARPIPYRLLHTLLPDGSQGGWVYVRVQSQSSLHISGKIILRTELEAQMNREQLVLGLYYGCFLVVLTFSLAAAVFLRDPKYTWYALYLAAFLVAQLGLSGHAFQYFFPNTPSIPNEVTPIALLFASLAFLRFTFHYLNLDKQHLPSRIFFGFQTCALGSLPLLFWAPYGLLVNLAIGVGLLFSPVCLAFAWRTYRQREMLALFYLLGLGAFLSSIVIYSLRSLGFLKNIPGLDYSLYVGSVCEIFSLSVGLSYHMYLLQKNRQEQQEALHVMSGHFEGVQDELRYIQEHKKQLESELEATTAHLVQADKLASLGTLVAAVAHDIASPNQLVILNQENALAALQKTQEIIQGLFAGTDDPAALGIQQSIDVQLLYAKNCLMDILLGAQTIHKINQAIRNQARDDQRVIHFPVEGLVEECLTILDQRLHGIEVQCQWPPGIYGEGRRSHIGQLLMNLLANAADAILDSQSPSKRIRIVWESQESLQILHIEDSGPGIPEAMVSQILQPFFTTKPPDKGTGLGLSIVTRIVAEHGGHLSISRSSLGGACFTVRWPLNIQNKTSAVANHN